MFNEENFDHISSQKNWTFTENDFKAEAVLSKIQHQARQDMPHKEPHSIYSRKILNKNSICDDPLRRNEKAQGVTQRTGYKINIVLVFIRQEVICIFYYSQLTAPFSRVHETHLPKIHSKRIRSS
jgi:hypothetical protein